MSFIYSSIIELNQLEDEITQIFQQKYKLNNTNLSNSISNLNRTVNELKDGLFVCVEYPYVDKTYRDSYYKYFASKRDDFARDCVRISFFKDKIDEIDFRQSTSQGELQEKYLGFIVLRPTFPNIIGRTVLNPNAFKRTNFINCMVDYHATVNGVRLKVEGFPHSSQDSETISCAETTVWSLLEYFGNKYPEYKPALPTQVNDVLGIFSSERLIPSNGLTAAQISYALKEFGFGVKIYSAGSYKEEFEKIIRIYVESGIPIVGVLQNTKGIGHALNIIGRQNIDKASIDTLSVSKTMANNVQVYEFENMDLNYVFVDDNYAPYQLAKIKTPATYYTDEKWEGCVITNIIVPLYPKIYLEAGEAKKFAFGLIEGLNLIANKDILVKTFLASSRSFKSSIALNETLIPDAKELLISTVMPKFVWVMEISDKNMVLSGLINGMVIMDATEPKRFGIIAALVENEYISNDLTSFTKINLPLQPFTAYNKNLR